MHEIGLTPAEERDDVMVAQGDQSHVNAPCRARNLDAPPGLPRIGRHRDRGIVVASGPAAARAVDTMEERQKPCAVMTDDGTGAHEGAKGQRQVHRVFADLAHPDDAAILVAAGLSGVEQQSPAVGRIEKYRILFGALGVVGDLTRVAPGSAVLVESAEMDADIGLALEAAGEPGACQDAVIAPNEKGRMILDPWRRQDGHGDATIEGS